MHKQNTFADSLTGGEGIERKTCTTAAITNYTKLYDVDTEIVLNKTQVVVGTDVMNAGVSSDYMKYCFYRGIPPNLYVLMQTMGCVDRCLDAEPGTHTFEIHLSFDTLVTMFIRIKQGESNKEQSIQRVALFEVLEFLVIPDECYHSYLEHYFEVVTDDNKEPCGEFCTY